MALEQVMVEPETTRINSFLTSAAGGVVTGGVVAGVNHAHGVKEMVYAGGRQFLYTLLIGGVGIWLTRRAQQRNKKRFSGLVRTVIDATTGPTAFTFGVNWAYHAALGTPEAFYSALATGAMAVATFAPYAVFTYYRPDTRI